MRTHHIHDMRDLRNRWLLLNEQFQILENKKNQKKQNIMKHIDQLITKNLGHDEASTSEKQNENATTTAQIAAYPRKIGEQECESTKKIKEKKLKEKKLKEKKLKEKKLKEKKLKEKKLKEKKLKEKKLQESIRRLINNVRLLKKYTAS